MAELVEGAPLLRAYTRKTRIVGSNPTLSAIFLDPISVLPDNLRPKFVPGNAVARYAVNQTPVRLGVNRQDGRLAVRKDDYCHPRLSLISARSSVG